MCKVMTAPTCPGYDELDDDESVCDRCGCMDEEDDGDCDCECHEYRIEEHAL